MSLFSKKNKNKEEAPVSSTASPTINEAIEIHVMPEKYRKEHVKVNQAKMTGIIILSVGMVVLLAMAFGLYYFLFADHSDQEMDIAKQNMQTEESSSSTDEAKSGTLDTGNGQKENPAITGGNLNFNKNNEDTATSSQEETIEKTAERITSIANGIDSDGDGLTDNEEQLLGTDLSSANSDGDGYGDLVELKNLYNPAGAGRLIENLNIREMTNATYHYSVYYPTEWAGGASSNDESIIFMSADNHFIQIITQPNDSGQIINDWYREQFSLSEIATEFFVVGSDWVGLKSPDGLTVYLNDQAQENIFALTYNIGSSSTLEYKNIFDMMVKSFKFVN